MAAMATCTMFVAMPPTFTMNLCVTQTFPMRMLVTMMAFPVAMPMMIASWHGALFKNASQQARYGIVCQSRQSTIQFDALSCKRALGAATNTAAQKNIDIISLKEARQSPMARTLSIDYLHCHDPAVVNVVQFECLSPSKMLENFAIFIRYCNPHKSLLLGIACKFKIGATTWRKRNVTALNAQSLTVHQTVSNFRTSPFVYTRYRGSRNTHMSRRFFLAHFF